MPPRTTKVTFHLPVPVREALREMTRLAQLEAQTRAHALEDDQGLTHGTIEVNVTEHIVLEALIKAAAKARNIDLEQLMKQQSEAAPPKTDESIFPPPVRELRWRVPLLTKHIDIRQGELAKELGLLPTTFSKTLTGQMSVDYAEDVLRRVRRYAAKLPGGGPPGWDGPGPALDRGDDEDDDAPPAARVSSGSPAARVSSGSPAARVSSGSPDGLTSQAPASSSAPAPNGAARADEDKA